MPSVVVFGIIEETGALAHGAEKKGRRRETAIVAPEAEIITMDVDYKTSQIAKKIAGDRRTPVFSPAVFFLALSEIYYSSPRYVMGSTASPPPGCISKWR